jgi:hypothetical protein
VDENAAARTVWPAVLIAIFASSSSVAILVPDAFTAGFNHLIVFAAAAAIAGHILVRSGAGLPAPKAFILIGLFVVAAFPAAFTAAATAYGASKTQAMLIVLPLAMSAPLLVIRTRQERRAFLWTFVLVNGVGVLLTLPHALAGTPGRIGIQGEGGPIVAGRAAGVVVLAALTVVLRSAHKHRALAVSVSALALAAASLVLIEGASRGPFLATLLAAVVLVGRSWSRGSDGAGRRPAIPWLTLGALAGTGLLVWRLLADRLPTRLTTSMQDDTARRYLFSEAWRSGAEQPLGNGWGAFPETVGQSGRVYPHNAFLELWTEGGWAIAVLFVVLVLVGLSRLWATEGQEAPLLVALLVFGLANAAVSGDLVANRPLFVLVGIGLAAAARDGEQSRLAQGRRAGRLSTSW